jgi:hypothetical protein
VPSLSGGAYRGGSVLTFRENPEGRKGRAPVVNAEALPHSVRGYWPTSRVTMLAGSVAVVTVKNGKNAVPFCPRPT